MAYDKAQIAKELTATALGKAYYGNALYVARDIAGLTDDDRRVLQRYLDGSQVATDAWALQAIAMRVDGSVAAQNYGPPLPCPFCGKPVDLEDQDTLYPSGISWRDHEDPGMRSYHARRDHKEGDGKCWRMHCPTPSGGCGAEISGDSKEEALAAWNRRPNTPV